MKDWERKTHKKEPFWDRCNWRCCNWTRCRVAEIQRIFLLFWKTVFSLEVFILGYRLSYVCRFSILRLIIRHQKKTSLFRSISLYTAMLLNMLIFFNFKDSRGVNLSLTWSSLNWMKFSLTYNVANVWNSLKLQLRNKSLSKFTKTMSKETLKLCI